MARAFLEKRPVQFLYSDGDDYHFMELENYEQFTLTREQLADVASYLKDGMQLDRTSYEGETIGIELPITVDLMVADTEPGFAGDTATGARKNATTETGLVVTVPLFVEIGDVIRVDTRDGATRPASDPGHERPGPVGAAARRRATPPRREQPPGGRAGHADDTSRQGGSGPATHPRCGGADDAHQGHPACRTPAPRRVGGGRGGPGHRQLGGSLLLRAQGRGGRRSAR